MADNNLGKKQYNYTYTTNYNNSNFHQNSGEDHERQAMYSSGAYGPGMDYQKYASAYTSKDTGGGKTSTGTGGGSSTSGSSAENAYAAYLAELNAQRQAAAEDAYNRSMGYLNDAYDKAAGNYWDIYNNGKGALEGAYNNSLNKINNNATDAMREAYINKMLSMKNLSQKLAAMGISGGASESTMAGLMNNYGNARNNIQRTWDENRGDLEQGYGDNLANLYNAYLERMTALDSSRASQAAQLLSNLNNQIASVQSDFYSALSSNPSILQSALSSALAEVNNIQPKEMEVTNPYSAISTQQGNDVGGAATNWGREQWENSNLYQGIQNLLNTYKTKSDTDIADMLLGYKR